MSQSDIDALFPSPNPSFLCSQDDDINVVAATLFSYSTPPPTPAVVMTAVVADRQCDNESNTLMLIRSEPQYAALERAIAVPNDNRQLQNQTATVQAVTVFRRHLIQALRDISANVNVNAVAPRCAVLATTSRCWIASPSNVPVNHNANIQTCHMFFNSRTVRPGADQRLVIAHPLDVTLQRPGEKFAVHRIITNVEREAYLKNLLEGDNLGWWGWSTISDALTNMGITVISASRATWSDTCQAAPSNSANADANAGANANANASANIVKFVTISAITADNVTVFTFRIVHNCKLPPNDHVIVVPHARGGDIGIAPTTWTWPERPP